MNALLERLGRFVSRHRWWVVGVWVLLLLGLTLVNRQAGGSFVNDYSVPGSESSSGLTVLKKDFTSAWRERAQLRFGRGAAWERRGQKERARQDYSAAANDYLETLSLNRLLQSELEPRLAEAKKKAAELGE